MDRITKTSWKGLICARKKMSSDDFARVLRRFNLCLRGQEARSPYHTVAYHRAKAGIAQQRASLREMAEQYRRQQISAIFDGLPLGSPPAA